MTWQVSKGRPVKQSNYGVYKQVVSTGEGMSLRRVTITGDTPEVAQEVAQLAAHASELFAALECEVALDAEFAHGQAVFKRHGYDVKATGKSAMQWVRDNSRALLAKLKGTQL